MIEHTFETDIKGSQLATFIVHPERNAPFPLVIFLMDAAGIREELRDMARRIATCGYYVMLPNLYHRSDVLELSEDAGLEQMENLLNQVSTATVLEDVNKLLAFAETDSSADTSKIGCVGYCMSGQYAIQLAAAFPEQVAAAASIHGVQLVTGAVDSPHAVMSRAKAEFYVGCAEIDQHAPLDMHLALERHMKSTGIHGEMEVYKGLDHGFVFPSRKAGLGSVKAPYDRDGDNRHWERLIALFARNLQGSNRLLH